MHHGVQRLVAVGLGPGDVIVELAGHRAPALVHARQRGITVAHVGDDHAQRAQVVDRREVDALALHLLPDAVQVLGPALHLRLDARGRQLALQALAGGCARPARAARASRRAGARCARIARLQKAERQVLQLPLDLPDAEPVGQRREHLLRFAAPAPARTAAWRRHASAASAGATPAAAAPRAGRARTRAASCARARSAARAARPRTVASRAARCTCTSLRVCSTRLAYDRRTRCAPPLRGAAESRPRTPDRRPRAAWARRRWPRRMPATPSACASAGSPVSSTWPLNSGSANARARCSAPASCTASTSTARAGDGTRPVARSARVSAGDASDRSSWRQQELAHRLHLLGLHQRRRMADAGEFHQPRTRAARAHLLRGVAASRSDSAPRISSVGHASGRRPATGPPRRPRRASGVTALNGTAMSGSLRGTSSSPSVFSCGSVSASHCSRVCGPKPVEMAHSASAASSSVFQRRLWPT